MSRRDNPTETDPSGRLYLGSAIRELRQRAGWRLEEMARQIVYHPGSLSKVENNSARPSERMLLAIAEFLEVDLEALRSAPLHPRALKEGSMEQEESGSLFEPSSPSFASPPPAAPSPSATAFFQPSPRAFPSPASSDVPAFLRRPSSIQRFRHQPSDMDVVSEAKLVEMRGPNEPRSIYRSSQDSGRDAEMGSVLERAQRNLEEAVSELETVRGKRRELSIQEELAQAKLSDALAELELARKLLGNK